MLFKDKILLQYPTNGMVSSQLSHTLTTEYIKYYKDDLNSKSIENLTLRNEQFFLKELNNEPIGDIPSWEQDLLARKKDGSVITLTNTASSTYYSGNFRGTLNIPFSTTLINDVGIDSGTIKYAMPLNANGTYKCVKIYASGYTHTASISGLRLYATDGWNGTFQEASNLGKISSIVFRYTSMPSTSYLWDTSTVFTGGSTGSKSYPHLYLVFKPLVDFSHLEFYSLSYISLAGDGLSAYDTEIVKIGADELSIKPLYALSGVRLLEPIQLTDVVDNSDIISWDETKPDGSSTIVECAVSTDGVVVPNEESFIVANNGQQIPYENSLANQYLWVRETLETTNENVTPVVQNLEIKLNDGVASTLTFTIDKWSKFNSPLMQSSIINDVTSGQIVNWTPNPLSYGTWFWKGISNIGGTSEIYSVDIQGDVNQQVVYQYENVGKGTITSLNNFALYQYTEVVLDPLNPTEIGVTLPCIADTHSYSWLGSGTETNGSGTTLNLIWLNSYTCYVYFKFDLSSLANIPFDSITKAEFRVYYYGNQGSNPPYWLKRCLTNWDESTLCWNNQPDRSAHYSSCPSMSTFGWVRHDVRPMLKEWIDGTYPNYGLCLEPSVKNSTNNSYLYSKEYNSGEFSPRIYIEYDAPLSSKRRFTQII